MSEEVKCMICGKIMSGEDALKHWQDTGHNNWELIEEIFDGNCSPLHAFRGQFFLAGDYAEVDDE